MRARSSLLLFVGLCGLSSACDTLEPPPTDPLPADRGDPLVEALDCPGLADPMPLESLDAAWGALYPVFSAALHPYMDDVQLTTAQVLAGGSACATIVEDGDTIAASGSCAEVDGLAFDGSMTVARSASVYESTWEDLSTRNDDLLISGDGTYRYETLVSDGSAFAIQSDRSWTMEGEGDEDGTFVVHAEGALGLPGYTLVGWVSVAGSSSISSGDVCFAMTCDSDRYVVIGGRRMEADSGGECRFLFQGDRLWEQAVGRTAGGAWCSTVTVDGTVVESDCD